MNKAELYVASGNQGTKLITKSFATPWERDHWVVNVLDYGYRETGPKGSIYWPKGAIWKVTTWEE